MLAARGEPCEHDFPFALARRLLEPDRAAGRAYERARSSSTARSPRRAPALVGDRRSSGRRPRFAGLAGVRGAAVAPHGLAFVLAGGRPRGSTARWCCAAAVQRARGRGAPARRARPRRRRPLTPRACHRATGGRRCWCTSSPPPRARRRARDRDAGARPASRGSSSAASPPLPRRRPRCSPARSRCSDAAATLHEAATLAGLALDDGRGRRRPAADAGLLAGGDARDRPAAARPRALRRPSRRRAAGVWHARAARGAVHPAAAIRHLLRSEPSADAVGRRHAATRRPRGARAGEPGEAAGSCAAPPARASAIAASC